MTDELKTLTLDPELQSKLSALAAKSGQSMDTLALDILREHAEAQESIAREIAEDEQRWQNYLATGQSVSYQNIRSKLHRLAAGAAQKATQQ